MQLAGAVALVALLGVVGAAVAGGGGRGIEERLTGYEEVPAISTDGSGKFAAKFARFGDSIKFRLSYRDLEGAVQQAHIHLGQEGVNGGISVFLCTNLGNGPAGTQACPVAPATVTGEIGPEDVIGPGPMPPTSPGQGIEVGAFDELVDAIEAGVTYVNVHSSKWPGGEIRAQLEDDRGH
ncbi:MAG TPA: CHRD domain-containing protein [Solirubrobacteraceae bacterium]|jgi:CHRD domain|nr:CHRD domain-containing protein [Solirubrobacteraceae bacterium]